ncbi:hypothetical protein [Bradyrhizobium lablabi]|uniref:hypothetical protein n=1 Tax=Bradyrhizobium lablabi TaxID=722472 RepID=UPI001BA8B096|nr:hypothetical protein [Bradyrhizobium lablabi]MBR0696253.1 hypothetical protein [Bradyrhizobium lablabi]
MLRDGEYAAWYRTAHGEGTGIVHLANGRISGGDCAFVYGGSYEIDEHRFTATVTTRRYADGPTTVFGLDEIEAQLTGEIRGTTAVCSGTAKQAPGLRFEVTLFLQPEASLAPDPKQASTSPDIRKLPKLPANRRATKPFVKRLG